MQVQDFQKLELKLHSLHLQLFKQNNQLKRQNQCQAKRLSELQVLANPQDLPYSHRQLSPFELKRQVIELLDKIGIQANHIKCLEQLLNQKSNILFEKQRKIKMLESSCLQRQLEVEESSHLKQIRSRQQAMKEQRIKWKESLERSWKERDQLIEQKQNLLTKLSRSQSKNYSELLNFKNMVGRVQRQGEPKQMLQFKKEFESIIKMQQQELHDRNEQIIRLRSNYNYNQSINQLHLKNTIKHLRHELRKYSTLVNYATEQLAIAQQIIERYSSSADKCNKELAFHTQQNIKLQQQNQAITKLSQQVEQLQYEVQRYKSKSNQFIKNNEVLLIQNECCRKWLQQCSADGLKEDLIEQRRLYKQGLAQRRGRQQWATITELIEVNESLKRRLKIK